MLQKTKLLTNAKLTWENQQLLISEALYRKVLDIDPKEPIANYRIALLLKKQKLFSQSVGYFKSALENNPNNGYYWLGYIGALLSNGEIKNAEAVLSTATEHGLPPEHLNEFYNILRRIKKNVTSKTPSQLAEYLVSYEYKKLLSCAKRQIIDNPKCSATYDATELKDPISVISGSKPIIKESEHLFFKLSKLKKEIISWLNNSNIQEPVRNKLNEWLEGELRDWDISRDSPYFGFEIPDHKDKYFYVWLDAPIGYLASHLNYLKKIDAESNFEAFWKADSNSEVFHFIGKDIMYFHTLFFPVMLSESDLKTPDGVFVHGFLTLNGEKMSKSRGNFISAENYIGNLDPDYLRYFFASKLGTGVDDIDLNLEDFKQKSNSDLVNKYANIASRTARFLNKDFGGVLSENLDQPELLKEFEEKAKTISQLYEKLELSKAIKEIMSLADKANQYIDSKEPWVLIKDESNKDLVHAICTTSLNLFRIITIMLHPVIPGFTNKAFEFLNENNISWENMETPLTGCKINEFSPIITRIDENHINNLLGN